jgi:hypothetical protein
MKTLEFIGKALEATCNVISILSGMALCAFVIASAAMLLMRAI